MSEERWEYNHTSWISEATTAQKVSTEANAHLMQWSDAGWELFTAQATPYVLESGGGGGGAASFIAIAGTKKQCFVYHVMIWRRRIRPAITETKTVVERKAPPPERESYLGWAPFHTEDR